MNLTKLVCMGDSLTEGYGIPLSTRWSNLLGEKIGIPVINSGISGDTTTGMLGRFQSMVIDHKPSQVIIMGGTNDIFHGLSDEHILSNIHAMTRQARYHKIEAIIGIIPPYFTQEVSEIKVQERIITFQQKLIAQTVEDERQFIDFSKMEEKDFLPDGLHPSAAGQKIMMGIVLESLRQRRYGE